MYIKNNNFHFLNNKAAYINNNLYDLISIRSSANRTVARWSLSSSSSKSRSFTLTKSFVNKNDDTARAKWIGNFNMAGCKKTKKEY